VGSKTKTKEIKMLSKKDEAIRYGIQNNKVIKRFNSKLSYQDDGCIVFNGGPHDKRDRYISFGITIAKNKNVRVKVHRFAYALAYGFNKLPINYSFNKDSLTINHMCHNTKCVNPKHLNVLTVQDNSIDGAHYAKKG
jgi:hypothetical protein